VGEIMQKENAITSRILRNYLKNFKDENCICYYVSHRIMESRNERIVPCSGTRRNLAFTGVSEEHIASISKTNGR
jgi:hypothetical protein